MGGNRRVHQEFWKKSLETSNLIKEKGPVTRHLQRILLELASKIEFQSVFEVGCGQGARLELIRKLNPEARCSGSDISSIAIKGARKNYPEFSFFVEDIVSSTIKNKYDLVLCLDVLEHIVEDERALRNIRRMTGKYCILSTIQGRMRPAEGPEGHIRNYGYEELINKVKHAGFSFIEVVEWGFPFYSPFYRDILSKITLAFKKDKSRSNGKKITEEPKPNLLDAQMPFFVTLLGEPLYQLMNLNVRGKGDYIFILAKVK